MKKRMLTGIIGILCLSLTVAGVKFYLKYQKSNTMVVSVEEVRRVDYPEDPSNHSQYYNQYGDRTLTLIKKSPTHFDFIFKSSDPNVATVTFKDIDVSLYVPTVPKWAKEDSNLEIIALVDQEWNRQQVSFPKQSPHIEISGGDGFEEGNLHAAELARNCLNAGLWEVLLFTTENGQKSLYYQGWFTFPLGHYKDIFEAKNESSYWKHWYRLEHWFDPAGRFTDLEKLRTVISEKEVQTVRDQNEKILVSGEQKRKSRTMTAKNVRCWGDFCEEGDIKYASFIPPGRYSVDHPWDHQYEKIASLEKTYVRRISCPSSNKDLYEVELLFRSSRDGSINRFVVGGVDLQKLPRLRPNQYQRGLYMPMGIGVGPFYQNYENLKSNPPDQTPYYSVLLDENDQWINHHEVSIDGPVMHLDSVDPSKLHLYLLSYERHTLVGHFIIPLDEVTF